MVFKGKMNIVMTALNGGFPVAPQGMVHTDEFHTMEEHMNLGFHAQLTPWPGVANEDHQLIEFVELLSVERVIRKEKETERTDGLMEEMEVHTRLLIGGPIDESDEIITLDESFELSAIEGHRRGVFLSRIDAERGPFALRDQGHIVHSIRLRGEFFVHHIHELLTKTEIYMQGKGNYMLVEEGKEWWGVDTLVLAAAQVALHHRLAKGRREVESIEKTAVRDERTALLNSWAWITSPPEALGTKKKDAGDMMP